MGTPNTPGESPASGGTGQGGTGQGGTGTAADGAADRAEGPSPAAGQVAGRPADAARAERARAAQGRAAQPGTVDSEAVTAQRPAAQRPAGERPQAQGPAAPRPGKPIITGTAAPKAQQSPHSAAGAAPAAAGAVTSTAPSAPSAEAVKSLDGVDAPTSHISRNKVSTTGMPDLSAIPHPVTAAVESAGEQAEAQGPRVRPAVSVGSRRGRGPLRASMQLRSIDPWSTLKISLLLSIGLFFVWLVAVGVIYLVLDGMGVWDRLNAGVTDLMENTGGTSSLIGPGQVFGVAAIIGIINVVLFTAMATIGAFVYNVSSDAVGGIEVTLADRD